MTTNRPTKQLRLALHLLAMLLLGNVTTVLGQRVFEIKQYGFSIQEPTNWYVTTNEDLIKNIDEYKFDDEKWAEFLKASAGSITLATFQKYKTDEHAGLIPTIIISVKTNPTTVFSEFIKMITEISSGLPAIFPDFKYTVAPKEIEISGIKSVIFSSKYSMKTQSGEIFKIKSSYYAIPYKTYYFQVAFIDGQIDDDCTEEFKQLVKTIKIGKNK